MFWAIIVIFTLLTSLLFGIGGFLVNKWWFKPKNNPELATIFVEDIQKPYKAKLFISSAKGAMFIYDKGKKSIFVPADYKVSYHNYRRDLFLDRSDNLIALPIGNNKMPSDDAKNKLIQELVTSNIGAEAVHAVKSRSAMSMTLIIVAVIIAIGGGIVGFAVAKQSIKPPITPAPISQPVTPAIPQSGEIKIIGTGEVK